MNVIKTIRDSDIGSTVPAPIKYVERKTSRAVVFDKENKVALFHSTKKHYYKLPGGGIDEGEDVVTALRRELLEEIGCEVENIRELAVIEEFRNQFEMYQVSYCFIADVLGEKGFPNLEEGELAEGFVTEWMNLNTAIKRLEDRSVVEDYKGKFAQMRDLAFLKEASNLVN
jgi:ADP-ribose pyrophosphatase YjhB (NUDIX family)